MAHTGLRSTTGRIALCGLCLAVVAASAPAADFGLGRRVGAVAEIDPTSAVVGSTEVRSLPSQEGEPGLIQIREPRTGRVLGQAATSADGAYSVRIHPPLALGQVLQAVNTEHGFLSSGVGVADVAPPRIDEPMGVGTTVIRGTGTPGHEIRIENAITGVPLGEAAARIAGDGHYSVSVPALPLFHAVRAVDLTNDLRSAAVTVLDLTPVPAAIVPELVSSCSSGARQPAARGFVATTFDCGLPLPRGVAAARDGSVYVLAGAPPSDLLLVPPLGLFRFTPADGALSLLAPVTGVALRWGPGGRFGDGLFLARPRVFNLRNKVVVGRDDGELFVADAQTGRVQLYQRLLDLAPSGLAFAPPTGPFRGDLAASSFLGNRIARVSAADRSVSVLAADVPGVQGLAFGPGGDFGTDLYAAQPGSGRVLRVAPNGSVIPFVDDMVSPTDVAFGPGGPFGQDLYVTDAGRGEVVRVDRSGRRTTSVSGLQSPFGLAFSSAGPTLVVSDYKSGALVVVRAARIPVRVRPTRPMRHRPTTHSPHRR